MISVVLATYNGEKFIRAQLESILKQSRKPDEIVINDDNSIDKTVDVINTVIKTTDIPILLSTNIVRKGYAQNFRDAVSRSHGDIVFLCDQDDVWLEDKIQKCMNVLEAKNEVLALTTGFYFTDSTLCKKKPSDTLKAGQLLKISWKKFIRHPKYPGMSVVFKKIIWSDIDSLDWKPKAPHDWMINQYAAANNGLYLLGDKLVLYRQHESNAEGLIKNKKNYNIRESRLKQIDELVDALRTITSLAPERTCFIKKMILFHYHRKSILEIGNVLYLLVYELLNIKYITMRSILGDMYVCVKSRKEIYV